MASVLGVCVFQTVFAFKTNMLSSGQTTGWTGLIRVDGVAYTWMGNPGSQSVFQKAFTYTATSSQFTMDVGGKIESQYSYVFIFLYFPTFPLWDCDFAFRNFPFDILLTTISEHHIYFTS